MTDKRKDDLFICRRTVGGGEYEGATCYYIYTPIEPYVYPPVPDDVAEALHEFECVIDDTDTPYNGSVCGQEGEMIITPESVSVILKLLHASSTPSAEVRALRESEMLKDRLEKSSYQILLETQNEKLRTENERLKKEIPERITECDFIELRFECAGMDEQSMENVMWAIQRKYPNGLIIMGDER